MQEIREAMKLNEFSINPQKLQLRFMEYSKKQDAWKKLKGK